VSKSEDRSPATLIHFGTWCKRQYDDPLISRHPENSRKPPKQVAATPLVRKRRLGHYDAGIWRDGRAISFGEDAPADPKVLRIQGVADEAEPEAAMQKQAKRNLTFLHKRLRPYVMGSALRGLAIAPLLQEAYGRNAAVLKMSVRAMPWIL